MTTPNPDEVLTFWFASETKPKWFAPDAEFDAQLRSRFGDWLAAAKNGELDRWAETAKGALALIVLLDQFSRNIHRGTPDAFAADAKALALAKTVLKNGLDGQFTDEERQFLYLPFMHSETLSDQEEGVALYERLGQANALDYMRQHRDIIARFGHFPHRNAILGRSSTAEEIEFLKQPGSSF